MSDLTEQQAHNLELTRRAFDAFNPDSAEELLALTDPEVEVFSSDELANPGTFHGHEGYLTWLGRWLEAWNDFQIEVLAMEAVGERHVVTTVKQLARGKGSGIPVEMEVAFLTELSEDKERYVALHLYASAARARAVAKRRELGPSD
jgi:ketosteroid isomerase-like protein